MKTAYVLSGGGAKGAFQVGAMEYLHKKGLRPDLIVGTSVGALNAAGYSYGGMRGLLNLWDGIKGNKSIIKLNWWRLLWATGIYTTKPLRKLLDIVFKSLDAIIHGIPMLSIRLSPKTPRILPESEHITLSINGEDLSELWRASLTDS